MRWSVAFTTDRFLPETPEEEQVNPGVYGLELASWLAGELTRRGFACGEPGKEDWGWYLEWVDGGAVYQIGCASVCEEGDGYRGKAIDWAIHVDRHKKLFERWRGAPDEAGGRRLCAAIEAALAEAGIATRVGD